MTGYLLAVVIVVCAFWFGCRVLERCYRDADESVAQEVEWAKSERRGRNIAEARIAELEAELDGSRSAAREIAAERDASVRECERLRGVLRRIASPDEMTGDGPLESILADPHGTAERELRARMTVAAEADSRVVA